MNNSTYHKLAANQHLEIGGKEANSQVYYCCDEHKWIAYIKRHSISRHDSKEEAEMAFIEHAFEIWHRY